MSRRFLVLHGLDVKTWIPDDAKESGQVHLVVDLGDSSMIVAMRSRAVVDELIRALESHRDEVFGKV